MTVVICVVVVVLAAASILALVIARDVDEIVWDHDQLNAELRTVERRLRTRT